MSYWKNQCLKAGTPEQEPAPLGASEAESVSGVPVVPSQTSQDTQDTDSQDVLSNGETRAALFARWESRGTVDPSCRGCREFYAAADPLRVCAPNHVASSYCESGKRAHCTCEVCW